MIQTLHQPVTFEEFIDWYPENSETRYELHRGAIVEMPKPKGKHSLIAGRSNGEAFLQIRQHSLPYVIPKECIIRSQDGESGYEPDVIVLDSPALAQEPLWEKSSVIQNGASVKLIVEVVSSNWRDDYHTKLAAYESLGIPEYWIVDYAALGGRRFIGNPKTPTLFVCELMDGEYEMRPFRGNVYPEGGTASQRILSPTFPDLNLTAAQLFAI